MNLFKARLKRKLTGSIAWILPAVLTSLSGAAGPERPSLPWPLCSAGVIARNSVKSETRLVFATCLVPGTAQLL